jgi:lipopolysaccharide biosynthesis glycosyltransferase
MGTTTTVDGCTAPRRDDAATVRIALAFNERYAAHAAATLQSVIDHAAPRRHYAVHAVAADLSAETVGRFERQVARQPNVSLAFHLPPDVSRYRQPRQPGREQRPDPYYYRLDLPTLLHPAGKVLYLDCDLIACSDVAPLFDTDIDAHVGAAARDSLLTCATVMKRRFSKPMEPVYGTTWEEYAVGFPGIPAGRVGDYFNSGVMLINLERWRDDGITDEILAKVRQLPRQTLFADQDLLNAVLYDRVRHIDGAWNVLATHTVQPDGNDDVAAARILHYAGNKPWTHADIHGAPYWDALLRTPFAADVVIAAMERHLPSGRPPPRLPFLPRLRRSLAKRLLSLARLAGGPQARLNR